MSTTTAYIPHRVIYQPLGLWACRLIGMASFSLTLLFISYFVLPHIGILHTFYRLNVVFILIVPLMALGLSILSLTQMNHMDDRSLIYPLVTLGITFFYFSAILVGMLVIGAFLMVGRFIV